MDTSRKVIVGYDLCEDVTQISCYSYKSFEPIQIGTRVDSEDYLIPTVLGLKAETKQWLFGQEAKDYAARGDGYLVDQLLTKLKHREEVEIDGQHYKALTLMEKYLRRTLTLIKNHFPTEPITKLVVTIRKSDPDIVDGIYEALSLLGIEKDRAVVMSHPGAYMYYALSQDKTLWMNDVGLFDFNEDGLSFYQIKLNRRNRPMIAGLTKQEFHDVISYETIKNRSGNAAYIFENVANNVLYKQIISTLYFTGVGFEGDWAEQSIKKLCAGRRVFYGQNLYTKGACYAAKELSGDKKLEDIILLNDDMITSTVSVRVYRDAKLREVPIVEAGTVWYEAKGCLEVIPEGTRELELIIRNVMSGDIEREFYTLEQLPQRPDRMTRLQLLFTCRDKSTGVLTVTDLGFGDFYPESGYKTEFMIKLSQ